MTRWLVGLAAVAAAGPPSLSGCSAEEEKSDLNVVLSGLIGPVDGATQATVEFVVTNSGSVPARGSIAVAIFPDVGTPPFLGQSGGQEIWLEVDLAPSESRSFSETIDGVSDLIGGIAWAMVDHYDDVSEADEGNNLSDAFVWGVSETDCGFEMIVPGVPVDFQDETLLANGQCVYYVDLDTPGTYRVQIVAAVGDVYVVQVVAFWGTIMSFETTSSVANDSGYSSQDVEFDVGPGEEGEWSFNIDSNIGAQFDVDVTMR